VRYHRADIVDRAISLLDEVGLEALSVRRLAGELGVRPSALYHHFASKAELLAAVADEIVARGRRPTEVVSWQAELELICVELRDTMLRHRDGASLLAAARVDGAGADEPVRRMAATLAWNGADPELARVGARTLFHYVQGHVLDAPVGDGALADFRLGLAFILAGLEPMVTKVTTS